MSTIQTPIQPLPTPSSPQKSNCGGTFCSWLNFYNGGAGYCVNGGKNYITVYANGKPVAASAYFAVVIDMHSPAQPMCVTNDNGQMCFTGTAAHSYLFTVCFRCPSPPAKTPVYITISPTP